MINDKLMLEMASYYSYLLEELEDKTNPIYKELMAKYPFINIIEIQKPYPKTLLHAILIQSKYDQKCGLIIQGSTNINDWKQDNFCNFLNKNVKQYEVALQYYDELTSKNYMITHVSGNSLGGGCAMYIGYHRPEAQVLALNASPLSGIKYKHCNNITHIRIDSDLLYRSVMLDSDRFEYGYTGNIMLIKRYLFGSNNYYHTVELAHRGSIVFPTNYLLNTYETADFDDLSDKMDLINYNNIVQINNSINIAQYLSFDLVTNNFSKSYDINLKQLLKGLTTRVHEVKKSLFDYHLQNIELSFDSNFLCINDTFNKDFDNILKHSLLNITKHDDMLYHNIYFMIDKTTSFFYNFIKSGVDDVINTFDKELINDDYYNIKEKCLTNKRHLSNIFDMIDDIYDYLDNWDSFKLNQIITKKPSTVVLEGRPFKYDYNELLFKKIDSIIASNIVTNRGFIEQIERLINAALKTSKATLRIPFVKKRHNLESEDIDYIIENYQITKIIDNAMYIFREDIYELLLSNSLYYQYYSNIICINEQLAQLILSIENLKHHVSITKSSYKKRNINVMLDNVNEYIKNVIKYNDENNY